MAENNSKGCLVILLIFLFFAYSAYEFYTTLENREVELQKEVMDDTSHLITAYINTKLEDYLYSLYDLTEVLDGTPMELDSVMEILKRLLRKSDFYSLGYVTREGNLYSTDGMGTTVTVLFLTPRSAIAAYVGDSRIYQLRKGKKIFRTFDHSMVFEMVKKKIISEEQARLSAQSNVILKALGVKLDMEVETIELSYQKGDRFVLCTDGFWGAMPEDELIRFLSEKKSVDKILDSTANVIESIGRSSGTEYDNLTAAILEMNCNSTLRKRMKKSTKILLFILSLLLVGSIVFNILIRNGVIFS